jgi:hypothetical protein
MKSPNELVKRETPLDALDRPIETPQSYNYGVDPNAESEVHLLDYWRAIRKRLWLVIGVVALITRAFRGDLDRLVVLQSGVAVEAVADGE